MKNSILISALAAFSLLAFYSPLLPVVSTVSAQNRTAQGASVRFMDMDKHLSQMQENMKAMHGKGGAMVPAGGPHDGMKDGDMMKLHAMTGNRLDIMQMMTEQIMQRDQILQSTPAK